MSEEKRKSKNWRLPEDLVEKLEAAFKEQDKCKSEQDFAAYLLGIGLDGRRKKSDSYKNMGMALLPNWDPEMPCRECGRKIPLTLKILYKEGVGAVCPSCQKEIALEEMGDPATLSKQITIEAQEKRIRQTAKILQVMYRAIYESGESIHLPEYTSLLLEAAKNENEVHKVFLMLIQERNLVPDKEAVRIYLEEAEKHKQCRISLERKRREIELKPITVGKIKEILQNVEYYVPVEVQPPQIEDKRSPTSNSIP